MLTALGKVLRVIRMEKGLLLKDMADLMDVKPSYISSIENGKRKPSENFIESVISVLNLTSEEGLEVREAYIKTIEEVALHFNSDNVYQMDLSLALARSFNNLTPKQATAMMDIINKGGK